MLNDSVLAAFADGKPQMHILLSNGPGTGISFTLSRALNFLEKAFGTSDVHFSDRITTALYILHTFTNAKMPRNDDSCRASITARLGMDPSDQRVCSADVQAYGLEVSRVVFQGPSERNFHIFYQLCAGATDEMKAKYFLEPVENYRYLNRKKNLDNINDDEEIVFEVRNDVGDLTVDDANDFLDLMSLLNAVGVQPAKQDHILRTVSAILLVGNIDFEGDEEASIVNPDVVEKVAELLRVDADALGKSLISCTRHVVGDDAVTMAYHPIVATRLRDALAQGLYTSLVELVANSISWRPEDMTETWIGLTVPTTAEFLFDEVIDVRKNYSNRFSQLLRNFMHEVIMNYRMEYTLFVGKEHWQAQGLQDQEVLYEENSAVLEVIGGRKGILALMDELCKQTWLDLNESPLHSYLVRCLQGNESFRTCEDQQGKVSERLGSAAISVIHTWGEVKYDAGHEFIRAHAYDARLMRVVSGVLSESTLPHVAQFGADGTAAVASSAGNLFKASVDKYLCLLTQAHPYFITTTSANRAKVADTFERDYVLNQLHYTGTSAAMNSDAVFRS
jgi:myosin heavy subunit